MKDLSDVLIVSFDSGLKDESALCVTRKCGERIIVLKMELGEQANILYHLLTEQMTKAEIKAESKGIVISKNLCDSCTNHECIFQSGIVRNHCDFYKAESEEV